MPAAHKPYFYRSICQMDEQNDKCEILKIRKLLFTDGTSYTNVIGAIEGGFLIIASKTSDPAPIWYNLNEIEAMLGTRYVRDTAKYKILLYPYDDVCT